MISHRWPHVLPGARGILFGNTTYGRQTSLRVLPREGGRPERWSKILHPAAIWTDT